MLGVLWTADTKDYEMPGRKQIIYTAVSAAQPGAIVLMHDGPTGRSETAEALPRIITRLRQRHYKLVTVPQMMRENPPAQGTPVPTSLSGGVRVGLVPLARPGGRVRACEHDPLCR